MAIYPKWKVYLTFLVVLSSVCVAAVAQGQTCCVVGGDADNDGGFNIADVTFSIARIFSGGLAPMCPEEADANADNTFNIADVTFSIARIFSGGPAPMCPNGGIIPVDTAMYTVTFTSTWSAATHPDNFPSNPHFSGLIGATHDSSILFWRPGEFASQGIKSVAEFGSKFALTNEVDTAQMNAQAEFLLSGGFISPSPGAVNYTFEITSAYPLVTLVSMLAPSPDWFVGVSGLALYQDGLWSDSVTVDLFVYDAGTDDGVTYTSANTVTSPPQPITTITTTPFLVGVVVPPVASFTFLRQ